MRPHTTGALAVLSRTVFRARGARQRKEHAEYNMHGSLKLLSYVIVLLMVVAILYAGYTSVRYWPGISV